MPVALQSDNQTTQITEIRKCRDNALYFYNTYCKKPGELDLTWDEYNIIVNAIQTMILIRSIPPINLYRELRFIR